jgi:hypothetical protein
VRKYGEAIGMTDFEMITTLELGMARPVVRGVVPVDAPLFFPERGRAWGSDCIFVALTGDAVAVSSPTRPVAPPPRTSEPNAAQEGLGASREAAANATVPDPTRSPGGHK